MATGWEWKPFVGEYHSWADGSSFQHWGCPLPRLSLGWKRVKKERIQHIKYKTFLEKIVCLYKKEAKIHIFISLKILIFLNHVHITYLMVILENSSPKFNKKI